MKISSEVISEDQVYALACSTVPDRVLQAPGSNSAPAEAAAPLRGLDEGVDGVRARGLLLRREQAQDHRERAPRQVRVAAQQHLRGESGRPDARREVLAIINAIIKRLGRARRCFGWRGWC